MIFFYVFLAVAATLAARSGWKRGARAFLLLLVPVAGMPCTDCYDRMPVGPRQGVRAASVALLALAALLGGCMSGEPEGAGGSGPATTTSTATDPCIALNCQAPQVCGVGCGESWGCYTPGGTLDAGPNDCPACFPMPAHNDKACGGMLDPNAFFCQAPQQLGGCTPSAMPEYWCCPRPAGGAPCLGRLCSSSAECCAGMSCIVGYCSSACASTGQYCADDSWCCAGGNLVCVNKTCEVDAG